MEVCIFGVLTVNLLTPIYQRIVKVLEIDFIFLGNRRQIDVLVHGDEIFIIIRKLLHLMIA